jgi:hypothetical protein
VRLDLLGQQRARAHEAHLSDEDVPELRELIERGRPEQSPDARHPCIAGGSLALPVGPDHHRAELPAPEPPPGPSNPLLSVEDWTAVVQLDGGRDEHP